MHVAWEYKGFGKVSTRDVSTAEPFVAAIVRLDPRNAQIVIARNHGAANAFVSFIGIVRGRLALLPFQLRKFADELSLFGSVGTGVTNARCSLGGPLVVLVPGRRAMPRSAGPSRGRNIASWADGCARRLAGQLRRRRAAESKASHMLKESMLCHSQAALSRGGVAFRSANISDTGRPMWWRPVSRAKPR